MEHMENKVAFDSSRLRGRIIEKFGTCRKFAEVMGFGPTWISDRLTGKQPWGADEIRQACRPEYLDIAAEDIHKYFFEPEVR